MLEQSLTKYIGVPAAKIHRLLVMTQEQIYQDPEYLGWIKQLDRELLHDTLPLARTAYEAQLPQFAEILKRDYGMDRTPMSAFTLGNWLVGFLNSPESLTELSRMHARLPQKAVREMLPAMIGMLDGLSRGRAEWQKALGLMALPLVAER